MVRTVQPAMIGTAGWTIPRTAKERFPDAGTHLARYAQVLRATEINSSFYRPHKRTTYERWAASTPPDFRFAVKMPTLLSHTQRLDEPYELLSAFLEQVSGLGDKLGPLLLQLPPKLALDPKLAHAFFTTLRRIHPGKVACEPRHVSYFTPEAEELFRTYAIARVAADPPRAPTDGTPGGSTAFTYARLHGSPRIYWSPYTTETLNMLATALAADDREQWVIFDNTTMGHATSNALDLLDRYNAEAHPLAMPR